MKTALREKMPDDGRAIYALSPDYRPELKKGHVLTDQSRPVDERIEKAKADLAAKLKPLIERGRQGDLQSQIEVIKETPLLKWLCSDGAKGWVEERYPQLAAIFLKYKFKVLDDGFVRFTLPKGVSYLELFEEANRYCKENGRERAAVEGDTIRWFAERSDAASKSGRSQTLEIQGLVPGSTEQTRAEQEELLKGRGLQWATLEAAAAAAALYYCATGKDLLDGKWVRTASSGLGLDSCASGLLVLVSVVVDCRYDDVGAAGARNLKT